MTSAWAFAVAAWARPGVEAICLDLQNVHGQLPALLLWRWRTLVEDRDLAPEVLAKAVQTARDWENEVLAPLRTARRSLRVSRAVSALATVRQRALETELEAERALLGALEALEKPGRPTAAPRLASMVALAEAWRPPAPLATLSRLVEAL